MKHVIFYDGVCPLCNRVVYFLLGADKHKKFYFAPLVGQTAQEKISRIYLNNPSLDTLVLLENFQTEHEKISIEGRAALRILWILGGKYKAIGILSFLPSGLFDIFYRLVARNRYRLFSNKKPLIPTSERFLP